MERDGDLGNYLKFNFENAIAIIDRLTKENHELLDRVEELETKNLETTNSKVEKKTTEPKKVEKKVQKQKPTTKPKKIPKKEILHLSDVCCCFCGHRRSRYDCTK